MIFDVHNLGYPSSLKKAGIFDTQYEKFINVFFFMFYYYKSLKRECFVLCVPISVIVSVYLVKRPLLNFLNQFLFSPSSFSSIPIKTRISGECKLRRTTLQDSSTGGQQH